MDDAVKNIEYKNFSSEYLDEIINIANARFGANYYTKDSFMENLKSSKGMCTVAIDKDSNEVLGYCIFFEESIENAEKYFKVSKEELINVGNSREPICHAKSLAIKEKCENIGIGTKLFELTLDKAKNLGYKTAWCSAWLKGDDIPAKDILDKSGFIYYKTVSGLWKNNNKYRCIVCNGPCRCKDAIYYKILN